MSEKSEIRDAATVILLRESDGEGPFEIFLLRRHSGLEFLADRWVFPGGRLDGGDLDAGVQRRVRDLSAEEAARRLGWQLSPERALGLYVAAIRETFEEAHLLLAMRRGEGEFFRPGEAERALLEGLRTAVDNKEMTLEAVAEQLEVDLAGAGFGLFAHWVTPVAESRRYDTRFFVTRSPPGQEARHDDRETTDGAWLTPREALNYAEQGRRRLAPPTVQTLRELEAFSSIEAVLRFAAENVPPKVVPYLVEGADRPLLVMAGDPLYPADGEYLESTPLADGTTRMVLEDGRWRLGSAE